MPLAEQQVSTWCYLFVHHARVDWVNERLKDRFHTFIHKSVVYKQVKGRVKKEERPTISGLLFVQGGEKAIRQALHDIDPVLYLMNDCSTRKTAVIPDRVMQAFIRVSRMDAGRIRFMSHPLDYYSAGHPLIRVTSGVLNGFEGYIVRIYRDKCLVTSVGDMIVAIKGVHKEQFENIGTYVRQRRAEQQGVELMEEGASESWKHELERSFFRPENPLDVMAITDGLYRWIAEASGWMRNGNFPDAAEAANELFMRLTDEERLSPDYWFIAGDVNIAPGGTEIADYVLRNRESYNKVMGKQKVDDRLLNGYMKDVMMILLGKLEIGQMPEVDFKQVSRDVAALGLKNNKTCQAYIKMAEAKKSGDIDYLISTCEKVFSKDLSPRVIYNMGGVGANATQAQRDRWNSFLRRVGAETGK